MNKIALLSNVTIESLAQRLKKDEALEAYTAPGFDTWKTELLNPSSLLWQKEIGTVYVLLHGPALFTHQNLTPTSSQKGEALPKRLEGQKGEPCPCFGFEEILSGLWDILSQARLEHGEKFFVVSTLDLPSSPALPLIGKNPSVRAMSFWREKLEEAGIPSLDLEELVRETGRERFYSAKMWYMGSLPFSMQGEKLLAREISRVEAAIAGRRKKCLVLDLDNTLWGGVIGEDGLAGISLASQGLGAQYRDVQRIARELSGQGVLLAAASKNNREDALLPFQKHPHTLLKEEDFVAFKADWNPKAENLKKIAQELNIGLDSLVFIDDSPVEREAVKASLPEVAVPDFPEGDSSRLPAFMSEVARGYFTALRVGSEDREKTAMYRAEARREAERSAHLSARLSLDGYLASLEMELDLHRLREDEVARAAQLTQKTNQFNLTARRYTEADMTALLKDARARVWIAELRDRFGDYGKICLVIVRLDPAPLACAAVDTFLMSCRVMGRGVEGAVLSGVERSLAGEGVREIRGSYFATDKNGPARDFWKNMNYSCSRSPDGAENAEGNGWVLPAPFPARTSHIKIKI